jgi:hypothetical protein
MTSLNRRQRLCRSSRLPSGGLPKRRSVASWPAGGRRKRKRGGGWLPPDLVGDPEARSEVVARAVEAESGRGVPPLPATWPIAQRRVLPAAVARRILAGGSAQVEGRQAQEVLEVPVGPDNSVYGGVGNSCLLPLYREILLLVLDTPALWCQQKSPSFTSF